MHTIEAHKGDSLNNALTITAADELGAGGAYHIYDISLPDAGIDRICFQHGPIAEVGVNGISNESLIAIIIDRLEHFQQGPFACNENAMALSSLQDALGALHARSADRIARGVGGTSAL